MTAALKRSLTHDLACTHGEGQLARVMAVGDGANDLDMLALVGEGGGLGVAYRAKEGVQLKVCLRRWYLSYLTYFLLLSSLLLDHPLFDESFSNH